MDEKALECMQALHRDKQLAVVLDLDQTLIHAVNRTQCASTNEAQHHLVGAR